MNRRRFLASTLLTWAAGMLRPLWAWATPVPSAAAHLVVGAAQPTLDPRLLRAIAGVVLPAGLGDDGLDAATQRFTTWIREYQASAEMSAGYGLTQLQVTPASPSSGYAAQLDAIERRARAAGAGFADLDAASRRAIIEAALAEATVDALPRRPNGRHIAADLMGHFFFVSGEGQDWLYNASIRRETCRGLSSSADRPKPLA